MKRLLGDVIVIGVILIVTMAYAQKSCLCVRFSSGNINLNFGMTMEEVQQHVKDNGQILSKHQLWNDERVRDRLAFFKPDDVLVFQGFKDTLYHSQVYHLFDFTRCEILGQYYLQDVITVFYSKSPISIYIHPGGAYEKRLKSIKIGDTYESVVEALGRTYPRSYEKNPDTNEWWTMFIYEVSDSLLKFFYFNGSGRLCSFLPPTSLPFTLDKLEITIPPEL